MATGNPIILGGGIGKGSPFTLGALLRVANVTPPTAADSIAVQRTQGGEVLTVSDGAWPLPAALTERVQIVGGLLSDTGAAGGGAHGNVILGRVTVSGSALAIHTQNVVIGDGAALTVVGAAQNNIIIGGDSTIGPLSGPAGGTVMIGHSMTFNYAGVQGANQVLIAPSTAFTGFVGGVFIGASLDISPAGVDGVVVGHDGQVDGNSNDFVAIGRTARIGRTIGGVAIGAQARAAHSNAIALGRLSLTLAANSLVVGGQNVEINNVLIGGGDTAAVPTSLTWRNTDGNGNNVPGGIMTVIASRGTGNAATQGQVRFETGTPGAAGAALQPAATRLEILPAQSAAGAAVNYVATNSPGAALGTLTNAPTAGNPEWVPVLFNGALRFLPVWP